MVNFNDSPNPLLDTVFSLYKKLEKSKMTEEVLDSCADDLALVCGFFNCNRQQAALLSVVLRLHTISPNPLMRSILQHLGLRPSYAMSVHEVLAVFVERNWMKPKKDIRIHPFGSYQISSKLTMAFNCFQQDKLGDNKISDNFELIGKLQQLVSDRAQKNISFENLCSFCVKLVNENENIPLASLVQTSALTEVETACFAFYCVHHFRGRNETTFGSFVEEMCPPVETQYVLRRQFRQNCGPLFEKKLLQQSGQDNFMGETVFTSGLAVTNLLGDVHETAAFDSQFMLVREPGSISHCSLIFNNPEAFQVNRLRHLFNHVVFDEYRQRMKEQEMPAGITALLYGPSGTGKTETVKQLARESGRYLLTVDAPAIRSKWVGETEKNISNVFREYKKAAENYGHLPILLFNEADALLTRRGVVKERGDHYENAIQNLLLQELEGFEGIFIGTTNLSDNLDTAFRRRLLFKIQFRRPDREIREALWQTAFPRIPEEERSRLAAMYEMTGSEIMNVKKKLAIEQVLKKEQTELALIESLCKEELSMETDSNRGAIGFRRA